MVFGIGNLAHAKDKPAGDPYDAAREAEGRLDYKGVLNNAAKALELANSHERLVNLYRLMGTASAVLGKTEDAVDAFTKLLAIDPEHKLPRGTSPKINTPFKEAGGYWVDRPGGLQVVPTLPRELNQGKALSVPVRIEDPLSMTTLVRLNYRIQGEPEFSKLETAMSPTVTLTIPPEQLPVKGSDYVLELYVTAVGSTGSELRQAGDASHPLSIAVRAPNLNNEPLVTTTTSGAIVSSVPPKPKKPLIKQWWLWTAVGGVAAVGLGLGLGLGLTVGAPDKTHVDVGLSSR